MRCVLPDIPIQIRQPNAVTLGDLPCEPVRVKPIFHQNAKYLVSDTFASGNAKSSTFALADARNTNMLVSFALGDANFLRWPCTFHFLCVYFICVG